MIHSSCRTNLLEKGGSMAGMNRWAWVAGASEGLGLAFAEELAARGYSLVLIARRTELLETVCSDLSRDDGIELHPVALDLASDALESRLTGLVGDYPPEVAVYNAAFSPIGSFASREVSELQAVIDVNVRGPVIFSHVVGRSMLKKGAGSLVLMSSLAGEQGAENIATYAASKAFITRLGEGLWQEFRARGVHVLCCIAGAVDTPGYRRSGAGRSPGMMEARMVAAHTLDRLADGPRTVPGIVNKLAALLTGRWLPRKVAIRIMSATTARLGEQ